MGGAQEFNNCWVQQQMDNLDAKDKYEEGGINFEEKISAKEIMAKSSTNAYNWEEESSNSREGNYDVRKERLVIKFRRISEKYYMVDEIPMTEESNFKYFNYKSLRYSFPTCFNVTPKKNNNPKVVRCKTCRKVFSKMSSLKVHRKTHAAFAAAGPYTPKDFAKRFSTEKVSREPYRPAAHLKLLESVDPHPKQYPGYTESPGSLPYIKPGSRLQLHEDTFSVGDMIGEGGFAKVYSGVWENGPAEERNTVLKVQMPANDWEWYILNQVGTRFNALSHPLKEKGSMWAGGFMSAPRCFTYRDGAVIISQLQKMGTLLDLVNLTKNADKSIIEPMAIYLTAELLGILELLHSVNIVHADLKPDNFLIRHTPSTQSSPSLQLIDFGKAIDLQLEAGQDNKQHPVKPSEDIDGESNTKPRETPAAEVNKVSEDGAKGESPVRNGKEGRTGKYHLDYFGIAGSAYCLLFGKYIEVGTSKNRWVVKGSFKRWWQVKLWEKFFDDMLNPKGEEKDCLPDLLEWRDRFLKLFEIEDLREGLIKARGIIEIKLLEKWRRTL